MKPFTLDATTYFLPQKWSEVTFDQFQRITSVRGDEEKGGFEKAGEILHIITGLSMETINEAGQTLIMHLFEQLEFLEAEPNVAPVTHFTVKGETYYVNPLKQFGELAAYDRVISNFNGNMVGAIPYLMAVLCRKQGETMLTDREELTRRGRQFTLELDTATVLGIAAFFLKSEQQSHIVFQRYSRAETLLQNLKRSLETISTTGMVGKARLSIWQRLYAKCLLFSLNR